MRKPKGGLFLLAAASKEVSKFFLTSCGLLDFQWVSLDLPQLFKSKEGKGDMILACATTALSSPVPDLNCPQASCKLPLLLISLLECDAWQPLS